MPIQIITGRGVKQGRPARRLTATKARIVADGCGGIRLHDLRHTCASLAISAGANVKVVQRLLGHKTAVLTLDRYGHLFPDDLDAVASAFDTAAKATADGRSCQTLWRSRKHALTWWWQVQDSNL